MADINIEQKRPSLWPWVFGLLLLVALVYGAAKVLERNESATYPSIESDR